MQVKHAPHEKGEFLRAPSLSKLDNTVNSTSIFNAKYVEFTTKWQVLLHFNNPTCACKSTLQSPPKIHPFTSVNFHLPIPPLLVHKIVITIPTNNSFPYTSVISHLPLFGYNHCNNLHQKYLPTPTIQTIQAASRYQVARQLGSIAGSLAGSLVRTDTVLLSPFHLNVWTVVTGLAITDSSSLRLRKLIYCKCGKPSNPPFLMPSTNCHYFHTPLIPPQELTSP